MSQVEPVTPAPVTPTDDSPERPDREPAEAASIPVILRNGHLLGPIGLLLVAVAGLLGLTLVMWGQGNPATPWLALLVLLLLLAFVSAAALLYSQLLKPLVELEQAVGDVCQGEPWSALPMESVGVLGPVARDLDSLSGELIDLYEDMDNRVARQTRRLAQQTASVKILYDVAASINQVNDMDELLSRFLLVLKEMVHARAASVQIASQSGRMRLVASVDEKDRVQSEMEQLPVPLCACGRTLSSGDILCCSDDPEECSRRNGRRMYGPDELEEVSVPLDHHGDTLGLYRLYIRRQGLEGRDDLRELLSTIGNHLGVAIAKQRSDEEAHRLSIIRERTALAHELHDSLAQTLASLRLQVRMLDETLQQDAGNAAARNELERIRNGLDEAHTELRELLNSFRAPVDERGLDQALENLVARFRQETGISTFLQRNCRQIELGASEELQILRIVQECLANIRKHARAQTVRILLSCRSGGLYSLLVEDDGVGFDNTRPAGHPGEHIGLSIMEERARRLGGELKIESEPGEGTRVELLYQQGGQVSRDERCELPTGEGYAGTAD